MLKKNQGARMFLNKMVCLTVLLGGSVLICSSGCGGGSSSGPVTAKTSESPVISGKDQVKERLQAVAASGSGGSALGGVRQALEELKKTDAALADQLLQDLSALEQTDDVETLKKLATDMIAKL